jgi:UTP--glucose-1-phosphate uridylyltransferase
LGSRVTILTQTAQEGYAHAVFCAKYYWVDNEPFFLMLGEHVYKSEIETSCARQILDIYSQVNHSVIGLRRVPHQKLFIKLGVWLVFGRIIILCFL